jgi:hypothetical protein
MTWSVNTRYLAIILLSLGVLGCRHMTPANENHFGPAYVRVRNESGKDLSGVFFQGNRFGDVKNGASSDYQAVIYTSDEISVGLPGNTNRLQYVYVDSGGRFVYGTGHFTYVLKLRDNSGSPDLRIDVEEDDAWEAPHFLALKVSRIGKSNVVFRLKNISTEYVSLPSAGYALSGLYFPLNTNPAYAMYHTPEAVVGLWLTRDWHYVGTNWMWASSQAWQDRLKIKVLNPGDTLDVVRSFDWGDAPTNTLVRFRFQIPEDWAKEYGLWQGSLSVTGFHPISPPTQEQLELARQRLPLLKTEMTDAQVFATLGLSRWYGLCPTSEGGSNGIFWGSYTLRKGRLLHIVSEWNGTNAALRTVSLDGAIWKRDGKL